MYSWIGLDRHVLGGSLFGNSFEFPGCVLEKHHHQAFHDRWFVYRLNDEVYELLITIGFYDNPVATHLPTFEHGLSHRGCQFQPQSLARHRNEVPARVTHRRLKVFACPPVNVYNLALFINHHTRRTVTSHYNVFNKIAIAHLFLKATGFLVHKVHFPVSGCGINMRTGYRRKSHVTSSASVNFPLPVNCRKRAVKFAYCLGSSQKEKPIAVQGIVKKR